MSFILDALKKSETERQQTGSAEFAGVPTSAAPTGAPRWLWILGLLLAINLAVLLGLLLRPDVDPQVVSAAPPVDTTPKSDESSFMEQVAAARQNVPAQQEPPPDSPIQQSVVRPEMDLAAAAPAVEPAPSTPASTTGLPTFYEVIANGTIELPDLHLDIHVYSAVPEDRFVFINMSKQREESQLSEGPVVEEITPDGVVLAYRGTSFLLPRD